MKVLDYLFDEAVVQTNKVNLTGLVRAKGVSWLKALSIIVNSIVTIAKDSVISTLKCRKIVSI